MKQSSKALGKAQDQVVTRRKLLESGRVRLKPEQPKVPSQQEQAALDVPHPPKER